MNVLSSLRSNLARCEHFGSGPVRSMHKFTAAALSPSRVVVLQPGLVTIEGGLSPNEQAALARIALERGADSAAGFWKIGKTGERVLNSTPYRGRIFAAVDSYPTIVTDVLQRCLKLAAAADKTVKPVIATHCILLYYQSLAMPPPSVWIPWHQDNGENDGEGDYPVVSFTLGDSCDFLINDAKPKVTTDRPLSNPENLKHRVRFASGDVMVFGGPSRMIWHAIYDMHKNTAPAFLPFSGARLNFTFRYTPKILGDEERFATRGAESLPKDNQFYKLSKMK